LAEQNRSTPFEIKADHTAKLELRLSDPRTIATLNVQYIAQAGGGHGTPGTPLPPPTIRCQVDAKVNGKRARIGWIGIIAPDGTLSRPALTEIADMVYELDSVPDRYFLLESQSGYSSAGQFKAGVNPCRYSVGLGLPVPGHLLMTNPVEVRLVPGVDMNGARPDAFFAAHAGAGFIQDSSIIYREGMKSLPVGIATTTGWINYANIDSLIPSSGPKAKDISLGGFGRLLLRFDPPLVLAEYTRAPGITEVAPMITFQELDPGEACEVRFGMDIERAAAAGNDPAGDAITAAGRLDRVLGASQRDNGTARGLSTGVPLAGGLVSGRSEDDCQFAWVEIRDSAGTASQPRDNPGIDLTGVVGHVAAVGAMVVLLDLSGSMTDDESGTSYRRGLLNAAPGDWLYRHAALALRDDFLLPAGNGRTQFRLITFHGSPSSDIDASNAHLMRNIEHMSGWSTDPAQVRGALTQIAGGTQVFTHYTPLASALAKGAEALAAIPAPSKAMIVITDGEGTGTIERTDAGGSVVSKFLANERLRDVPPLPFRQGTEGYNAVLEIIFYMGIDSERHSIYEFIHATGIPNWLIAPHEVASVAELRSLLRKLRVKYGLAEP
jgi:hypothetical protein